MVRKGGGLHTSKISNMQIGGNQNKFSYISFCKPPCCFVLPSIGTTEILASLPSCTCLYLKEETQRRCHIPFASVRNGTCETICRHCSQFSLQRKRPGCCTWLARYPRRLRTSTNLPFTAVLLNDSSCRSRIDRKYSCLLDVSLLPRWVLPQSRTTTKNALLNSWKSTTSSTESTSFGDFHLSSVSNTGFFLAAAAASSS